MRLTLAALLLSSTSVTALAAAPAGEEIVVTAPLEGSRIESLQGAEVLTRDQIIERLNGTLGELLSGIPGVSSTFYGVGAGRPIIRGLGDDRIRVLENGIGVIDASSASPDHAVSADPLDARRIEVLRGSAALAYGGNAVGGVVNVIDESIPTFAPEKGWAAQGLLSYSTVDQGIEGALTATAAAGDFVFTGSWSGRETDDYDIPGFAESAAFRAAEEAEHEEEHEHEDDHEEEEEAFGSAPNSSTSVRSYSGGVSLVKNWGFVGIAAKRFETTYGLPGHDHAHEEEDHEGEDLEAADHDDHDHAEEEGGAFIELKQTRYETRGDIKLNAGIFTRLDFAGQYADYTHTEFEAPGEPGTVFYNEGFEGRVEAHNKALDGRLSGATGIQVSRSDFSAVGDESFIAPTVTNDWGVFTVQRYDTGDWGLEGGLRVEGRDLDNATFGTRDFTAVSASAGAFVRPAGNWFAGVTIARTERAPTNIELFANGPHLATGAFEVGDQDLDIETATSVEGSLRYDDGAYRVELNVYHIGFDGYVGLVPSGVDVVLDDGDTIPEFLFVQRDATFTGGELSASARLGEVAGFTITADAAVDLVRASFDAGGGDIPRIPPRQATLGLEAQSDMFGARIELVDIARQNRIADFETPTDGSTVLNARLSYRPIAGQDITLLIDGRNLTDEEVRVHSSFLKDELPRPGASVRFAIAASY
jgi:iron complex outermembrane receptor protein